MKLRLLALALTIGCLYSCSSAKKAQTTDDVYYSSGNQEDNNAGGYVANDGSDDRVQSTSTGDSYGQYAYGDDYAPFSTCISPFWGAGFGMSSYYNPYYAYSPFGFGAGMGFGWSSFYSVYPSYYGGFYNPYYPAYGYYTKPYGGGGSPYFPGRIAAVTYNNRHFNNINTTVPTLRGITPGHPITNTVSGRAPISLASNKMVTSQWQPYRTATDNGRVNTRQQPTSRTLVRQGTNNGNVRTNNQPTYRPAPSNSSFGRSSGGGFGGGGGGGRIGGGSMGRGGH